MLLLPAAALGIKQAFSAYPPSSFEYPGTFEHVCIQRGLPPNDEVQLIFALPPDAEMPAKAARGQRGQRSNDIPLEVSLEHSLRSGSMPRSRQVATVKVVRSRSVYASINHILENASEVTDVRILGGLHDAHAVRVHGRQLLQRPHGGRAAALPRARGVASGRRASRSVENKLANAPASWLSGGFFSATDHASEDSVRLEQSAGWAWMSIPWPVLHMPNGPMQARRV